MSERERVRRRACGRSCSVHSEDPSGEQAALRSAPAHLALLMCHCGQRAHRPHFSLPESSLAHTALRELFGRAIDRLKSSCAGAPRASERITRVPRFKSSWVGGWVDRRASARELFERNTCTVAHTSIDDRAPRTGGGPVVRRLACRSLAGRGRAVAPCHSSVRATQGAAGVERDQCGFAPPWGSSGCSIANWRRKPMR